MIKQIKMFSYGRTPGNQNFEENVNRFLRQIGGNHIATHVTADSYPIVIVEYLKS